MTNEIVPVKKMNFFQLEDSKGLTWWRTKIGFYFQNLLAMFSQSSRLNEKIFDIEHVFVIFTSDLTSWYYMLHMWSTRGHFNCNTNCNSI